MMTHVRRLSGLLIVIVAIALGTFAVSQLNKKTTKKANETEAAAKRKATIDSLQIEVLKKQLEKP